MTGAAGRQSGRARSGVQIAGLYFSRRELLDLAVAWVALGVAFTAFLFGPGALVSPDAVDLLLLSMVTAGVGFVIHELAHKVVAVRFGQVAGFRADYGMLFLAVMSGLAGFLFAAPGAVYHRGQITLRQQGLVSLAGPAVNLLLAGLFAPLLLAATTPSLARIGQLGVTINAFLAAFNMLPFGPLDGRSVIQWSKAAFLAVFLTAVGLTAAVFLGYLGFGFGI